MSADTIAKYVAKPATSFAVGGAIGAFARPGLDVTIMGKNVPAWLVAGLVCAVGSEIVGLAHDYVFPHVTELTLLNRPAETALSIALNAGAGALTYSVLVPGALGEIGVPELIGASALAEVISGYANEMWWKPMLQQYY